MLRRLLRLGLAALGLLALLLLALWISIRPPRVAVPPQGLVVEGVTLVNPGLDRRAGQTLTVRGQRIESIEPAAPDASGEFAGSLVLPGLIDLHVHHPPFFTLGERELFALLFLLHGVTSVRDVGSFVGTVRGHARRIESGRIPGPRIFSCGPLLDGDPPGWPGALVVESPDAARRAVRELAQSDVDCVKVYNGVSAEIFDAIRDAAATAGLRTVAHVPWEVPFERIREAEVQHLMGLEGHSWRVPERRLQRYVEASRAHGISHTPTLVAFARAAQLEDYAALRDSPVALLLPRYYRELLWNPEENPLVFEFSPASGSGVEDRLGTMQEVVRRLHAAEVPVLAGTDTMNPFVVPGAGLQEELGHLADAGLSLEEAWTAATRRAGEALGVADLGVLRTGAPADFLIFDEDPSRDLAALATLRAVVAAGRLYPVAMLEEAADRQRARLENAAYETVAKWAARLGLAWIAAEEG